MPRLSVSCESWTYLSRAPGFDDPRFATREITKIWKLSFSWKIKYQVILWNATSCNRQALIPSPYFSYQHEEHLQLNDNSQIFQFWYTANRVEQKRICLIVKEKFCLSRRISLKVCNSIHFAFVLVLYSSWNNWVRVGKELLGLTSYK